MKRVVWQTRTQSSPTFLPSKAGVALFVCFYLFIAFPWNIETTLIAPFFFSSIISPFIFSTYTQPNPLFQFLPPQFPIIHSYPQTSQISWLSPTNWLCFFSFPLFSSLQLLVPYLTLFIINIHLYQFFQIPELITMFSFSFLSLKTGELVCEELSVDVCAFSIASSGKRCLLETSETKEGKFEYQCRTSEVVVEWMADYIETDKCINACGLDRNSVGIASDALLEPQFTAKLCSPACYQKCPNIVDLYFNMAAGEGQ